MTEQLVLDDETKAVPALLQQLVFEDNMFRKLNAVDTLLSALEPDMKQSTGTDRFHKWLHENFINSDRFMRRLNLYSKMNDNVETALELYGQDYYTHPEFYYEKKWFVTLNELNKAINRVVGKLLKEFSRGETIDI